MGLDLTISEQTDFRKDEKGRPCHTVVELLNISGRIGHLFLDLVGGLSELPNCSTMTVDAMDIFNGLDTMRDTYADYDKVKIKSDYEEALNTLSELRTSLCEKHSISNRDIISKWDSFCTEEELEQKHRITDDERNELTHAENVLSRAASSFKEMEDYGSIIAEVEAFVKDNNLKRSELTWGDRTFEVHIWY